jgi:formate hydrogenlyase transcriptional activator
MSTIARMPDGMNTQSYESVLRISEAISVCREPEEFARIIADQLGEFLSFNHLGLVIFKENSKEIECLCQEGSVHFPEVPVEELSSWHVYNTQEPLYIADWYSDQSFPRLRELTAEKCLALGSVIRVPLTTPHRRLGALGIAGPPGLAYGPEEIDLMCRIARVVAFAIDDALNLRKAQQAQAELQHQNDRLQLLLNLTNRITSTLELRELLRAIAANIRQLMQCDGVGIILPEPASGNFRMHALDFRGATKFLHEDLLFPPADNASQRAFRTLSPVVVNGVDPEILGSTAYKIALEEGLESQCFIPLVNHGRARGVLAVGRVTGSFTQDDVEFLSHVSGQLAVAIENALAYHEISELRDQLAQEKLYLEQEIRSELNFEQIVGTSAALKHALELVETVAPSDSTVLLLGETGTGKELIARAIHDHSRRKDHTFVKMNCAAIPTGLLESELFGHEKGAFTGAISQKSGRLELANQGTLFLDEVGDIPIEIQPKLLRALQEREFERLGSTHTRKVSVRMVAATNRDLERMIADKEFRSDLYYRLNVFPIQIPPLRERREDIPLLVSFFVQKFSKQMQKNIESIPPAVMRGLTAWDWPGNIRELENFVERAVILTRGRSLDAPMAELRKSSMDRTTNAPDAPNQEEIARFIKKAISTMSRKQSPANEYANKQREEIVRALIQSKGRVGGTDGAAAHMGVNRTTLHCRMKKLGIDRRQYA